MKRKDIHSAIPDSVIERPKGLWQSAKYHAWRAIYPIFPEIRDGLLSLGIIWHKGRQRFLIGKLAPGKTPEHFLKYLETKGFGNHFIAWEDDGEVVGVRRLDGFDHQYHLRIFKDGEVRGHYEYTPESRPYSHWAETGEVERRDDFLSFCGDWIVPVSAA